MNWPTVTIILVNYNGKQYLQSLLPTLLSQKYPKTKLEIVVVDNNSTDSSVDLLKEKYSTVRLIQNSSNEGFGKACNQAARMSKSELIVLLNNDTTVEKNWLKELITPFTNNKNKKLGAVVGKTLLKGTTTIQNAGIHIYKDFYGRDIGAVVTDDRQQLYEKDSEYFSKQKEVTGFSGVNTALKRSLFLQYGGFNELYFMYYEDLELSLRLKRDGYAFLYQPTAQIQHDHAGTSTEWSDFFIEQVEFGHLLTCLLHAPPFTLLKQLSWFHLKVLHMFLNQNKLSKKEQAVLKARISVLKRIYSSLPTILSNNADYTLSRTELQKALD